MLMKKDFLLLKRSRWLLFALLTMMVGASPTWADELTVHDGTESSYIVPLFGYRSDSYVKMEYVLPSSELTDMAGGTISDLKYYLKSSESSSYGNANFVVFLKEVSGTTISAFEGYTDDDIVYQGSLDATGETLDITFTKNYSYGGGNLLIGIYNTVKGTAGGWQVAYYYGETAASGASAYSYSSQNMASASYVYKQAFLPKTTFTYTAASCKPVKNLAASNVSSNSADITWTEGEEGQDAWQVVYSTDANFDKDAATPVTVNSASYALTGLESGTQYYVAVRSYCSENEQSAWATTNFKTAKVAVPATGFTDDFETNKGWDFVNGSVPNKWVRGTDTNNGGSYSLYVSYDGTTYPTSSYGGSSLVYATKLFSFEAGDYTIVYDWKCYGEGTYDFLRVGLIPGDTELTASTSYSSLGSGSTLPSGWTMWLDGKSKLGGSNAWSTKSVDFTIETAGNYQVVFAWRNDGSSGNSPAAIDNLKIIGAAPVLELGGDVVGTTLAFGSVAETTNKTIRITNSGKVAMENITLTETADEDNVFAYTELPKATLAANEYMDVQVTFSGSSAKDYTGTFRVTANDCDPIDVTVTATYSNSAATMAIALGEEAVGASVTFGNVGKQATKTFTVVNDGDQTLNVTISSNNTTDFTVAPAALAVTGHSSETFTVTFVYPDEDAVLNTEKTANITVTPSNEGIDPVTFAVTGTRIEQWSEDFSGNALPDGWETSSSTYWTFADGVAKGKYSSTAYYLTTPSLKVESTTDILTFDYVATGNYVTINVQKSKNGGDWESCTLTPTVSSINTGASGSTSITGLEAGNYKFCFKADDYNLDNFQGFKRNMNDPKLGIYSDAECTAAVATSVAKDFGFATETQTANYYIKNDGTGTMTLALGAAPDGITQSLDKTSVAAGEHATLTITMPAESKGYNGGNVVVTATDLGTFTVAASGVIVDEGKMNLDFSTATIPTTWTTNSWSKNADGYAEVGYSGSPVTMQTSNLTAVAGEELVVVAKQSYTSSSYSFGVKYKKTDAEEWSDLIPAANIGTSYVMLHGTIAEAGTYQLQFNGQYTQIQRIYGLSIPEEPVMVVYDGESLAAATYNFGNVSDEADAVKTFTVKNEGKAELTGLSATLSGTNASHYSVEVSATSLNADETATVTVKQLKDNLGTHAATLTISATDLDDKVIALSGRTLDASKLFVDFESGSLPTGWTKGAYWSVSQVSGNYTLSNYSSSAQSVVTTPLTVAENETLTFGASRYYSSSAPTLKVRYTADGGLTWSEYTDFSSEITSSYSGNTFKELTLTGVPAGTVVLEFYGAYVRLDNIYGFTATTAPLFALTESSAAVENNSTKEFGTLTAEATATYTLTNNGTADMVSTVATTGVATAAISGEAEGVTIADNKVTLAAGKSATITLTLPYEAPYGEKEGVMTITTEGWVGDFAVNYTATTIDPTALYEDFASNAKPEGWYQETSGWTFTTGTAHIYTGIEKSIITEQYGAESGKNVLTFDAKLQSANANGDLKVYTSTNRKTWTLVKTVTLTGETQTVALDALADGSYYVKFQSLNASIDNLAGLKKLTAPAHDLYVSATTFPTTTLIPETSNGVAATATVYSLRADETGVYAKLFFDETEMVTSEAKSISKDGSQSFTMTCNVPAEEKTYAAKIVVYYSDETVAWETATTDVVVSQTRTLEITDFALTSETTAEADADNQFTSTFNVTVKNTGTVNYEAANVSVSVTDTEGNVYATSTWTAANSSTIYMNSSNGTNDIADGNAVLKAWAWNTDADGIWVEFQKISDGFYSAELAGKQNFIVARFNPEGTDTENVWNNVWNQSGNLSITNGNIVKFSGYDDKTLTFSAESMGYLDQNMSTTLKVTVTTSALEGGEFTFKAKENMSNSVYATAQTVTVTASAPKFEMAVKGGDAVADGDAVAFGLVKEATTKTYTITNSGTKALELVSIVAPTGFSTTALTDENKTIAIGGTLDIDVTLAAEQGKVSGDLVFTYAVDANTDKTFTLALSGRSVADDTWVEEFTTEIPASWTNNGWEWNSDRKAAYSTYSVGKTLMTPRLTAEDGEELTFDLYFPYSGYQMKVQYSTDKTNWTEVATYTSTSDAQTIEGSFTAPAAGNYYLLFGDNNSNSKYAYVDNFVGFKLNPLEHDTEIAASSVPATGKQYNTYTATVTLKESAGKAEEVTAKLYVGDEEMASETETITANGSTTVTLTWEPQTVISEAVKAYVAVTGTDIYLATEEVDLTVAEVYTLDETVDYSSGVETISTAETILLNRTFAEGWNTVCLPFTISDVEGFFGEGAVAYDYTGYSEGALTFSKVTSTSLAASYPYIVYVKTATTEPKKVQDVTISSTNNTAFYRTYNNAKFQGTYAPMAAGTMTGNYGVTSDAKIAKGTDKASMKGFRAYFELPDGVSARIAFFDEDGTVTYIGGVSVDELTNGTVYNMQGQRITSPNKSGLYIINGKKTVVKKH